MQKSNKKKKKKKNQLATVKFMILLAFTIDITTTNHHAIIIIHPILMGVLPYIFLASWCMQMVREFKRTVLTKHSNYACRLLPFSHSCILVWVKMKKKIVKISEKAA